MPFINCPLETCMKILINDKFELTFSCAAFRASPRLIPLLVSHSIIDKMVSDALALQV